MKHYTKRTIALCLASLVTVVGAFGAENYQNNLMSLKINNGSGGYVSMTAYTEKPYNLPIKIMRNDANTYILVFPGTGCEAKLPKLSNYENIESIGISTFPYTYEREGYTQITIKTIGAPNLKASTMLFIPEKKSDINESKVIEDNKLRPAVTPDIKIEKFEDGKDIEFTIETEVLPEITLGDFSKISLKKYTAKVPAEEIEKAKEYLIHTWETTEVQQAIF